MSTLDATVSQQILYTLKGMKPVAEEYLTRNYPRSAERQIKLAEDRLRACSVHDALSALQAYARVTSSPEWARYSAKEKIRKLYASVIAVDNIINNL